MKRWSIAVLLCALAAASWALATPEVGSIDYAEGKISILRLGKTIADPNIGDPILSGDLVKTSSDGLLIIAMGKASGMSGIITVRARSTLYINLDKVKDQPRTKIDIIAGSIGSKVAKAAGVGGSMSVASSSAVMAVRGTEFEIYISVNMDDSSIDGGQAILVTCAEGSVALGDGRSEIEVPAGKAAEKRPGKALGYLPLGTSTIAEFGQRWVTGEISAFRADAPRALAAYAKRYDDLSVRFAKAYARFKASPIPKKWSDEDRAGTPINPLGERTLSEKKEMAGILLDIRKVLFMFERVYYRADELAALVSGSDMERIQIRRGLSAGDFIRKVQADRADLEAAVARYRYIVGLYAQRSPDGGVFAEDDGFFGSMGGY